MQGYKADRTLNMTEDGKVVETSEPAGILGFVVEGQEVHPEVLQEFGIKVDAEGRMVLPTEPSAEPECPPEPPEPTDEEIAAEEKAIEAPEEDKAIRAKETKGRKGKRS